MYKHYLILILVLLLFTNCGLIGKGSGNVETRQYEIANFNQLDVSSGFEVEITQGNSYEVLITTDDNLFNKLKVYKSGSTLHIGPKPGVILQPTELKTEIVMPSLVELELSGASEGVFSGFSEAKFCLNLSGGSELTGMDSSFSSTEYDLSGGSTFRGNQLSSGNIYSSDISGGSTLDLGDTNINSCDFDISGGSTVSLSFNGTGSLIAEISGGSILNYTGNPTTVAIDSSGGSIINHN
ncbi:MAG: DUF2807 domain-containing protein [Spirochaetes bacterium]|nr:DUF2807 domain-containing protein [Spirochaetota bacterium]